MGQESRNRLIISHWIIISSIIKHSNSISSNFLSLFLKKTRRSTLIKTKFKISDDQTNIDKYRLAANITVYHILSKLILQRIIITLFGIPIEFPNQRKEKYSNRSINKELDFCGPESHLKESAISDLEFTSIFQVKEKKYSNRSINKEIGLLWFRESFEVKTISDLEYP